MEEGSQRPHADTKSNGHCLSVLLQPKYFTLYIKRNAMGRDPNRAYLRGAPGEAHVCVLAGLGGERCQARRHGVPRQLRGTEVPDLPTENVPKHVQ